MNFICDFLYKIIVSFFLLLFLHNGCMEKRYRYIVRWLYGSVKVTPDPRIKFYNQI